MNILDVLYFVLNIVSSILNYFQPTLTPYSLSTIRVTTSTINTVQTSILLSTLAKNSSNLTTISSSTTTSSTTNKSCPVGYVGDNCETGIYSVSNLIMIKIIY